MRASVVLLLLVASWTVRATARPRTITPSQAGSVRVLANDNGKERQHTKNVEGSRALVPAYSPIEAVALQLTDVPTPSPIKATSAPASAPSAPPAGTAAPSTVSKSPITKFWLALSSAPENVTSLEITLEEYLLSQISLNLWSVNLDLLESGFEDNTYYYRFEGYVTPRQDPESLYAEQEAVLLDSAQLEDAVQQTVIAVYFSSDDQRRSSSSLRIVWIGALVAVVTVVGALALLQCRYQRLKRARARRRRDQANQRARAKAQICRQQPEHFQQPAAEYKQQVEEYKQKVSSCEAEMEQQSELAQAEQAEPQMGSIGNSLSWNSFLGLQSSNHSLGDPLQLEESYPDLEEPSLEATLEDTNTSSEWETSVSNDREWRPSWF